MEYRKRRRKIPRRRMQHTSYVGTVVCVVLLFASIVYLIGVSSAGTWMAKAVVAPVFRTLGIPAAKIAVADQMQTTVPTMVAPLTDRIRQEEKTRYALQIGVYENIDNASKQADQLQTLGAAGYILHDGNKYRVLAACYPNEDDLASVRSRLAAEGIESSAFLFSFPAMEWIITAEQEQIQIIRSAIETLCELGDMAYAACYSFDSEKKTVAAGKASLQALRSETEACISSLSAYKESVQLARQLSVCLEQILHATEEVLSFDEDTTVLFSAKMKHLYLLIEDCVFQFFKETNVD